MEKLTATEIVNRLKTTLASIEEHLTNSVSGMLNAPDSDAQAVLGHWENVKRLRYNKASVSGRYKYLTSYN